MKYVIIIYSDFDTDIREVYNLILLSAENISKSYSEKTLLNNISLHLDRDDKVGIIGINGTGKTTLLNILSGKEQPNEGNISLFSGAKISYLEQTPVFDASLSLIQIVFKGSDEETKTTKEYEAKSILTKLGFTDFNISTEKLSGGEKKRVAIARALVNPCDVLILDEPTNHLDSQMVLWLENYLKRYNGALVMVTHDRYFLDRVVNRIVEIDDGSLYSYDGGYSRFLALKAQREEMELATARKNRSLYKKELEWMQQGVRARGTKSKSRIARFESLSNGIADQPEKLEMESVSTRLGRKTIEIDHISKSFNDVCIIKDFSYNILRNARIGIIGANGLGKSTLIKMITKTIEPDSGEVIHGDTVKIGYVSQEWEAPPDGVRVIDYIKETGDQITTNEGTISASKILERFLFTPDMQWSMIAKLSGGEKRRLYLLKILMDAPNILFLDEPTNDLDTLTLTVLENYLESFNGAVIAISHDRYFLDKVVNTIFEFQGNGIIKQYNGNYSDYLEKKAEAGQPDDIPEKLSVKTQRTRPDKITKLKFTFKEQREYDTIDQDIADLERELSLTEKSISENASNYEQLASLIEKKEILEAELSQKMERWVYLCNLAEKIEASK